MKLNEVIQPLLENKVSWVKKNLGKKLLDATRNDSTATSHHLVGDALADYDMMQDPDYHREADMSTIDFAISLIIDYFIEIDPTPNNKYLVWIANRYVENDFKLREDHEALHDLLKHFHNFKKYLDKKDINQYKSMAELHDAISGFLEDIPDDEYDAHLKRSNQVEIHIDNEKILLVTPLTEEASKHYGQGTTWCTRFGDHFESYSSEGPLYYLIDKNNGEKYNFHFVSGEFQDASQNGINIGEILDHYDLFDFFEKKGEIDELIRNTPNITREGDQYYLVVDDLSDLAHYVDDSEIRRDFIEDLLSGDSFQYFEIIGHPDELFIIDNTDNKKEYMNKTMELLKSALKTIFGKDFARLFDSDDLHDEEDVFNRLREIIQEEDIPEDILESQSTLDEYITKSDELKDVMMFAYIDAKALANEGSALQILFSSFKEVGINVDEIQWESSGINTHGPQLLKGKVPIDRAIAYQIILEDESELNVEFEQPYYGWDGDVTYESYYEALHNKVHDLPFKVEIK